MDTLAWVQEGRTVEFEGRSWILTGEPVYDPTVEHVGEFEGTPLYADLGVAQPYSALFIPLEMDYSAATRAGGRSAHAGDRHGRLRDPVTV